MDDRTLRSMPGDPTAPGAAFGAVLAGGAGRRMGREKALVRLAGRPLVAHAIAAVRAAGLDPVVIAKPSSELPDLGCPIIREPEQPRHPLCGILAALRGSDGRAVTVMACDMPFVTGPLIAWLASLTEPLVVCETGAGMQPLLGRYHPSLIDALEAALGRGASMRETVGALRPRVVGEPELRRFGVAERLTFNLNDPADLAAAEEWASQAPRR